MTATKKQMDAPAKVRAIIDELSAQFYERREALSVIAAGLFSGKNTYLLGDPGTAKSMLVRAWSERVVDAHYWETLLDRQLPLETIFGPIDIIEFRNSGRYHRNTDGYAPWAHFLFLDEVGKAGPAVLNPLLTLLNEGIYHNNSKPMACNILTAVGASNEELEPELAAMWDRWLLRLIVQPIQETANFTALLMKGAPATANPTTITLGEVEQAREQEVPNVQVPRGIADTLSNLRAKLRGLGVTPSDRRWRHSVDVLQAVAWINGRSTVDEDDLAILRHILWDVVEQIPAVEKEVLSLTSEFTSKAMKFDGMLDEIESEIDARKGGAIKDRAAYGGEAQSKVTDISNKLNDLIEKAKREGRATTKLLEVKSRLRGVKTRIFVECLNVPADRAAKMGDDDE